MRWIGKTHIFNHIHYEFHVHAVGLMSCHVSCVRIKKSNELHVAMETGIPALGNMAMNMMCAAHVTCP